MSETTETEAQETAQGTETEIDWKAEARKWEERSKSNKAELDELKKQLATEPEESEEDTDEDAAVAAEFGIESDSTEKAGSEKEESAANADLEKTLLENTRLKVALKYDIAEEDIELFLTGTTEEVLIKQAEALSKRTAPKVKPDAAQGKKTLAPRTTRDEFAAALQEAFN
jgi:hypothetical protein